MPMVMMKLIRLQIQSCVLSVRRIHVTQQGTFFLKPVLNLTCLMFRACWEEFAFCRAVQGHVLHV